MPLYKVTLKQGSRTHTIDQPVEAKSLQDCKDFFNATTTMQIIRIMEIVYDKDFDKRSDNPSDYYNEAKIIYGNKENILTAQFRLPCVKTSAVSDLPTLIKNHLEIDGFAVDTVNTPLY